MDEGQKKESKKSKNPIPIDSMGWRGGRAGMDGWREGGSVKSAWSVGDDEWDE